MLPPGCRDRRTLPDRRTDAPAYGSAPSLLNSWVSGWVMILADPFRVQACLVHTDQTDGGEMVLEGSQIPLGIRVQALVQQLGDNRLSSSLRSGRGNIHHMVQTAGRNHPHPLTDKRSCGILMVTTPTEPVLSPQPKKPPDLLAQLPQIQTQAAAHTAHVAGLHIAVDIIGEIRCSVFGRHLEEQTVVLCIGPVKITW